MKPENLNYLSEKGQETILKVYIQPKASKTEICGLFREKLKIRISSPPVEGAANRECIAFLAQTLGVPKSEITLIKGGQSREKTFVISRPMIFVVGKLKEACPDCL
jgi:uncharacterized protein (TIGR00251 family)